MGSYREQKHVSEISSFEELWKENLRKDTDVRVPLHSNAKLILGVFTAAADWEYRQVIRQTWMKHNGVCVLPGREGVYRKDGCAVHVTFVMGKEEDARDLAFYDTLHLNLTENIHDG